MVTENTIKRIMNSIISLRVKVLQRKKPKNRLD